MRKFIVSILLLIITSCSNYVLWADSGNADPDPLTGAASRIAGGHYGNYERIPANVDILVVVDDNAIAIRFNGDFGDGRYCITDAAGNTIVGTMTATEGGFEIVSYTSTAVGTNSMSIQFVGGGICSIEW